MVLYPTTQYIHKFTNHKIEVEVNKIVSKSFVYSNWRIMIIVINNIRTIIASIVDKILISKLNKVTKLYIKNRILMVMKHIFC